MTDQTTDLRTVLAYESGQESMRAEIERLRGLLRDCLNSRTLTTGDRRGVICDALRDRIEAVLAKQGDA